MTLKETIEKYFEFAKHKTNLKTEILAGVSTFLALSYIFVVNPAILAEGGFDKGAVLFATIVASALSTMLMGVWAKKPLVLAPGMEMNAYVAFFVIQELGFSWQEALGAVFWSGIICLLITISDIRTRIIQAIPDKMKAGLSLCVGVFLMLIALRISGILTYEGVKLSALGGVLSPSAYVLYAGLAIILLLQRLRVIGGVLISIILASILAHVIGLGVQAGESAYISSDMFSGILKMDLTVIFDSRMLSVILVLFLVDFYGSVAKFIGLTRNTTILDKDKSMPHMKEALVVDGLGTIGGAALGTTSIITYVESAVGIGEGGRTGLTAIVCGILMLLFLALTPLVELVPVIATTGALVWVGIALFPSQNELKGYKTTEIATLVTMIGTVIYTFAIDKALLIGFATHMFGLVATGRRKEISIYMAISTILLLIGVVIQLW